MVQAIKKYVTIQAGGRIEVTAQELHAGQQAEIIILVTDHSPPKSYVALLGSGRGAYDTVEEADRFLREQRDEWDH